MYKHRTLIKVSTEKSSIREFIELQNLGYFEDEETNDSGRVNTVVPLGCEEAK